MDRKLNLPPRLAAAAGWIRKGASVADIGTDHGYLAVHLALNGLAGRILACDVRSGPLSNAMRAAEQFGVI